MPLLGASMGIARFLIVSFAHIEYIHEKRKIILGSRVADKL